MKRDGTPNRTYYHTKRFFNALEAISPKMCGDGTLKWSSWLGRLMAQEEGSKSRFGRIVADEGRLNDLYKDACPRARAGLRIVMGMEHGALRQLFMTSRFGTAASFVVTLRRCGTP